MKNKSMKKVLSLVMGAMSSLSFASGKPRPNNVVRSNRQNVRNKNSNGTKIKNKSPVKYVNIRYNIKHRIVQTIEYRYGVVKSKKEDSKNLYLNPVESVNSPCRSKIIVLRFITID